MKILFLHGLESGPHGAKYQALKKRFGEVISPDCTGIFDAQERLRIIVDELKDITEPLLIVGSSMGGLMALLYQQSQPDKVAALVLCAPAIHRAETPAFDYRNLPPTKVIHGRNDDVVPFAASSVFGDRVISVDDDHRLSKSMDVILAAVETLQAEVSKSKATPLSPHVSADGE
ncbi:MAG: alpha/beta fold hydrolase [Desulfuromonadales bacterium]|nr:alpha/beta fold hydrolase [Desulfuromonadales bacterium]MBN2790968.1 alpha/beta fold hydrolase [Desulfuromonadales bacterium]